MRPGGSRRAVRRSEEWHTSPKSGWPLADRYSSGQANNQKCVTIVVPRGRGTEDCAMKFAATGHPLLPIGIRNALALFLATVPATATTAENDF